MTRTILLSLLYIAIAPGQVLITSTEATSKEVVVRYLAPHNYETNTPCNVQASYTNDFSEAYAPLADVDLAQFPGSDVDTSRNPKPFIGRSRTVVIGKQIPFWRTLPASATTQFRESLAVKAAQTVYVKITCGQFSDTASVTTKTVPFGLTFAESTPADPNAPGFANWPSVKWGSNQTIIDPEYGTELKRPDAAGGRGRQQTTTTPQEAFGTGWTKSNAILADDSSSATIAGSQAPLVIAWPYAAANIGSISQFPGDTSGLDWIQLVLKGAGDAPSAADRTVQACISVDAGVNCYSPWHDVVLDTSQGTYTYPSSPVSVDHWQAAGDRPIPRQWLAKRSGMFQYTAGNSTVTITGGDHVGERWTAGTKFRALSPTSLNIKSVTAGTPLTIETMTDHGFKTGDSIVIANANGTLGTAANGSWTVTVVDSTHFTLDGSTGSGTFGFAVGVYEGTAGSPPLIYAPNSYFPDASNILASGFTDAGWTGLNGNVYTSHWGPGGDSQRHTLTGATTTGAFSQAPYQAKLTLLKGTVQRITDYSIATIIDSTHFTLASGPDSDITSDTPWSVSPVAIMIRKKTPSADTVNLQFAQVKIQTSAGNSWAAAGGEICAPYDAVGTDGKLGSLCTIGSTMLWIPRDGSVAQSFGKIGFQSAGDIGNLGVSLIGDGGNDRGSIAINPNDPNRMYAGKYRRTGASSGGSGFDQSVIVAQYEGDYTPRPANETAASLRAAYPTYGAALDYPWLPNCYGDGKLNDGVNPRLIPTKCVSYKVVIPSIQEMIAASDTTHWNKYVSAVDHLPCIGGAGARMNFVYRPSTNSVWASISCVAYNDEGGVMYVFDLGNEKPVGDSSSTVRLAASMDSWSQPGGRWSKFHGGLGHRDGYVVQGPHPQTVKSGVSNSIVYNQTCAQCGPYFVDYLSVDGVSGAPLTNTLRSCSAWAGSPYLPAPAPDGTGGKGCNTVVVSGEPCDESPSSEEAIILGRDPAAHAAKCGASGRYWVADAIVGDIVVIDHDADRDYQHVEPAILIAKNGNTWVLYRGEAKRVNNGNGGYAGAIDHNGDTKRLVMQFSYDTTTGGYPMYYRPYDPVGTVLVQKLGLGHGATGDALTAGSSGGSTYGVMTGSLERRLAATSFDFTIASRGLAFEGKRANDVLSTDSHMTYVESASLTNKDPWVVDCAPWNGYDGVAPTGPVAGTATVYKWTGAQLNGSIYTNQFPKFLAPEVRIGVWVARNISGPASVIDDSQPYTFCEAYAAGECRQGSAPGDVFVAAPLVDQLASKYQCCGNDFTGVRDIAISSVTETFSRCTQTVLRNDSTGSTGRALTSSLHAPRAEDSFKNMSVTNTGLLGVLRERGTEFVKSELFTITMPPIVFDAIDRTHFWQQKLPIRPYFGADNVLVRFGYEHYGDVASGQYYCTTRKENCIIGASTTSANPFFFEKTETYNGIGCATGCAATLPLIPNRVAYYEIVFRSGNTVLYTMPQQVVVSP